MAKRFVYFYLMKPAPDRVREVVPLHVKYWQASRVNGYLGGPFTDRTGGLILFETASLENATAVVEADPFVAHGLIATKWLKEWLPE